MTPQQIEAMKLALEALVMYGERHRATYLLGGAWDEEITLGDKAITALEEVLAQPERHELQAKGEHPAPCARHCEANAFQIIIKNLKAQLAQPEQEPVAHCKVRPLRGDESFPKVEIDWVNQPIPGPLFTTPPQRTEQEPLFKKIIDQHPGLAEELKALDEQEPVAWYDKHGMVTHDPFEGVTPLYTTPPQRTWVWLTKVERIELLESTHPNNRWSLLALCEALLKEKNT